MQTVKTAHDPRMEVDDLVLRFKRQIYYGDENAYHVEVVKSPLSLQGGSFRANVEEGLTAFQHIFNAEVDAAHFYSYEKPPVANDPVLELNRIRLNELGAQLGNLLPLPFKDEFVRLIEIAYVRGRGVRLVLEARLGDKADRLLRLPWEILFFTDYEQAPARAPRFQIVRRLLDTPLRSPPQLRPPLDLIHVIAAGMGWDSIQEDLQKMERDLLPTVVHPGGYVCIAEPGSVEAFLAAQQTNPAHILHFLGHGMASQLNQTGAAVRSYLQFIGTEQVPQRVTGEQLQQLLEESSALQMVVLSACDTGTLAGDAIAYDLVASGFPYVVAMQGAMPQVAARLFYPTFLPGTATRHVARVCRRSGSPRDRCPSARHAGSVSACSLHQHRFASTSNHRNSH